MSHVRARENPAALPCRHFSAHSKMEESKFSLGAAVFGGAPALGYAHPDASAPDAWLRQFARQHPDALPEVMKLSKGSRDCVLQAAIRARVALDVRGDGHPSDKQVVALAQALRTRGQPSGLTLISGDQPTRLSQLLAVTDELAESPIDQLEISGADVVDGSGCLSSIVVSAAQAFPGLRGLDLPGLPREALAALSNVRQLSTPAAPPINPFEHLSHLTALTVTNRRNQPIVTIGGNVRLKSAPYLTHFSTAASLTDATVAHLIDHAPALQQLSAARLDLTERSKGLTWGVKRLMVSEIETSAGVLQLNKLPKREAGTGPLEVYSNGPWAQSAQGLDAALVERFPDFVFCAGEAQSSFLQGLRARRLARPCDLRLDHPTLQLYPHTPQHTEQLEALRNTLQQMKTLQAPGAHIDLRGWQWSADIIQVLATALPTLPTLHFVLHMTELTDELLSAVIGMSRSVSVVALRLALQSDQHASAPWAFDSLCAGTLSVCELLRLPHPSGGVRRRVVRCNELSLEHVETQADIDTLRDRLQYIRFEPTSPTGRITIALRTQADEEHMLSTQLSLLPTLHLDITNLNIRVAGPLTAEACQALHHLPKAKGYLDLRGCTWPESDRCAYMVYTRLARAIPTTYYQWQLQMSAFGMLVRSVLDGVPERPAGGVGQPLQVQVTCDMHPQRELSSDKCTVQIVVCTPVS